MFLLAATDGPDRQQTQYDGGIGVFVQNELAAVFKDGLVLEGQLKADTKHGGKISFTLSHHAMTESARDWSAFEGRAVSWMGTPLSFSHVTGERHTTFIGRNSSDALVGVDVSTPGTHVAGIVGGVHVPQNGEIEI